MNQLANTTTFKGYITPNNVRGKILEGKNFSEFGKWCTTCKIFRTDIYKYSETTEDLPSDPPKYSSPFAASVAICQNFSTYGTSNVIMHSLSHTNWRLLTVNSQLLTGDLNPLTKWMKLPK